MFWRIVGWVFVWGSVFITAAVLLGIWLSDALTPEYLR